LKKKQDQYLKKRKCEGFDLEKIVVPLPDYGCLTKYKRDSALKALLQPYQTINPFGLKKPIVD
jgi:hypothetical protein